MHVNERVSLARHNGRRSSAAKFLLPWVLATAIGWAMASVISPIATMVSYAPFINPVLWIATQGGFLESGIGLLLGQALAGLTGGLLGGAVGGLAAGMAQSALLRWKYGFAPRWNLPTMLSWSLAFGAMMVIAWPAALGDGYSVPARLGAVALGSLAGGASSIAQSEALKPAINTPARWIPITLIGWGLTMPAILPPQNATHALLAVYWLAGSLALGAVTGLRILVILRERFEGKQQGPSSD